MRTRRVVIICVAAIVAASVAAFLCFLRGYASDSAGFIASKDALARADAIVVLTGGRGRTDGGLALLRKDKGAYLILSGVNEDAGVDSIFLAKISAEERGRIILEKRSGSTVQNAVEVRRIALERGFASIILVTSVYHMKRADYIFRRVMPSGVNIVNHPVSSPNFDEKDFWNFGGISILSAEYLKYLWARALMG